MNFISFQHMLRADNVSSGHWKMISYVNCKANVAASAAKASALVF